VTSRLQVTALVLVMSRLALADVNDPTTPADAFAAGQAFGTFGTAGAAGTISSSSGGTSVPYFNSNAPESSLYNNGQGDVGAAGQAKQVQCQTTTSSDAFTQQECDAVNYVTGQATTRPSYTIDPTTDPVIKNSAPMVANPGSIPSGAAQQCSVINVNTPAVYTTETCEQTVGVQAIACYKNLAAQCAYQGSPITTSTTSQTGIFQTVTLTPAGSPGLYNYVINLPSCVADTDGHAEIDFNLDTIGKGSYITVNLSNLDDAAAVAVNGYAVFAGYPNAGPYYSGSFFPQASRQFQLGYSWTENGSSFTANAKLMDTCPAGYAARYQSSFSRLAQSYTPYNVEGFFCNSEGKFMLNRHEGSGAWGGTVSATMPLQVGTNKIQVYWGTGTWPDACGSVTVTGQIFNVAPMCSSPWADGCAAERAAQ